MDNFFERDKQFCNELFAGAQELFTEVIGWRRAIHQMPEMAYEEHVTSALIARELSEISGVEVFRSFGLSTSVVAVIRSDLATPAVAIRAEMDATRLEEDTGQSFSSCMTGIMHSAGNDAHVATLIGAAHLIARYRDQLTHPVVLFFQPAEDGCGATKPLLQAGFLEKFNIGCMLGLHWWPHLPYGKVYTRKGGVTAFSDNVRVTVQGVGGHGASPHLTVDPVLISANLLIAIQSILAHEMDPQETAVLSFGSIDAGEAYNVIPEEVVLFGTMRSIKLEVREKTHQRLREFVPALARAYRGSASISFSSNYAQVVNDANLVDAVLKWGACFGDDVCCELLDRPLLIGKDFSSFSERIPSCQMFLGTGTDLRLYSSSYDVPESLLPFAVAFESCLAISLASR